MTIYDNISPLDYRYYKGGPLFEQLKPYLSEEALINYKLSVEAALAAALAKRGVCTQAAADEIAKACKEVTADEVYEEDKRIKHLTRALVNCVQKRISDEAKPYVHFTTTSFDIIDTANAARYKAFTNNVLVPTLKKLQSTLIELALREKDTVQIGRTHGQHAVPITVGYTFAEYVERLGVQIQKLKEAADDLRGTISGAVGAYNGQRLFFPDPEKFEEEVLAQLNLKPGGHATQVVEPEYLLLLLHHVVATHGILANLADDMRHLQRSELREFAEAFGKDQVGSSTMPHKRNPWNFENVKSMWKVAMPRLMTYYMDQICEHQRDLSNSASARFIPELFALLTESTVRTDKIMSKIVVDEAGLKKNFDESKEMVIAEAFYLTLAAAGHPDAHEYIRQQTLESQKTGTPVRELIMADDTIKTYRDKLTDDQKDILNNPEKYTGISSEKTASICKRWHA